MSRHDGATIGIDLGTTYSCVAYYTANGEVQIITNDQGNRTTPSYVTYTEDERLVGDASKTLAVEHMANTIYDAKRFIGRKYDDPEVQQDLKSIAYTIVKRGDQPMIKVKYLGKDRYFRPEEVSAVILAYLKEVAERTIGTEVKNAVITVPAYFNDSQRQATKDAGRLAGLNVLRIINEPTAAAMAYGLDKKNGDVNILVFDLGGGTFDVSLLSISPDENIFQVLATAGDTHLGGEDFDNALAEHLAQEYQKATGMDVSKNQRSMRQIKIIAEQTKRTLSAATQVTVCLDHISSSSVGSSSSSGHRPFSYKLSRARFNAICGDLFKKCLIPVSRVLEDSKKTIKDVDEVVMVGGSSRIPKIQELLRDYFGGKQLNLTVNPDEAVAYGAAIHGAFLSGQNRNLDILLVDVAPLTLGVETLGGKMDPIIPRQKTVPCEETKTYYTAKDNQTSVSIKVFEGERTMTEDNNKLGEFELSGIPPKPKGMSEIKVTFSLDINGILSVSAEEHSTGAARTITITNNKGRLTREEIELKLKEAEQFKQQDKEKQARVAELNETEEYLYAVRGSEDKIRGLTAADRAELEAICTEGLEWLAERTGSSGSSCSSEQIRSKRLQWEKRVMVVYNRVNTNPSTRAAGANAGTNAGLIGSSRNDEGEGGDGDGPVVEDFEN